MIDDTLARDPGTLVGGKNMQEKKDGQRFLKLFPDRAIKATGFIDL